MGKQAAGTATAKRHTDDDRKAPSTEGKDRYGYNDELRL